MCIRDRDERTWRQMNLIWGVTPLLTKEEYSMEILLLHATEAAEEKGYVKEDVYKRQELHPARSAF